MVKVIPWETACIHCNVRLSYYKEDIQLQEPSYYPGIFRQYIICPVCGKRVYLRSED